ncbi:MAG: CRTAC1 family protein [Acidobacteriota bacterium]
MPDSPRTVRPFPRRLCTAAAAVAILTLPGVVTGDTGPFHFVDRTEELGVDFRHRHFGTGEKYMPENMGPGVAILDVDGDGRLDLYFVQGAPVDPGAKVPADATARLFRQRRDGTFEDVTQASGAGFRGVAMGVSFGDVDRDGDLDLYVTAFGGDAFLRNRGDGTFEDATAAVGLGKGGWSTGSTFFDPDGDGDLDLYVSSYVDFTPDNHKWCGKGQQKLRAYCHPDVYGAAGDVFYRNDGGRFVDAGRAAGIVPTPDGKGLGVLAGDVDGDGDQDLLVANDSTMNYLYLGDGKGGFEESALLAGVGFNATGAAEAGMGVEMGDLDGDGRPELLLTHLDQETNTLYRPAGEGLWVDATEASGLGPPSLPWVGFGVVLLDHDLDGDLDAFVANGHIIDNIEQFSPGRRHRQPAQLLENRGGRFYEVKGALDLPPLVGRGAAAGDLDRDGDLDLVVAQNDGDARVLVNRGADGGRSLTVGLVGQASNPQGFGARLELRTGKGEDGRVQTRFMKASTSYLSQGPPEVVFGLGGAPRAEVLEIRWPSGQVDRHGPLDAGGVYTFTEGATSGDSNDGSASDPDRRRDAGQR